MIDFYERKIASNVRERKKFTCNLEIKSLNEKGIFAGYGSVFDVIDSQNDVVLRGAFASSIDGRKKQIKLLWQHDMKEPIGIIEEIFEDERGLYIEGRLLMQVARAKEAYSLMKEGVISGLSIGYSPLKYKTNPDNGVRELSSVELWEVSLVTFPANDDARITTVKQIEDFSQEISNGQIMQLASNLDRAMNILNYPLPFNK